MMEDVIHWQKTTNIGPAVSCSSNEYKAATQMLKETAGSRQ